MKEIVLNKSTRFSGRVFTVKVSEVELPDGKITEREIVEHNGGVCILAKIADEVLLVRQYRLALECELLEFPAGKLEKNEDPMAAAQRELREETGYQAGKLIPRGYFAPSGGYSSELIYLFEAEDLTWVGQELDATEFLEVVKLPREKFRELLVNQEIIDGKTLALAYRAGL